MSQPDLEFFWASVSLTCFFVKEPQSLHVLLHRLLVKQHCLACIVWALFDQMLSTKLITLSLLKTFTRKLPKVFFVIGGRLFSVGSQKLSSNPDSLLGDGCFFSCCCCDTKLLILVQSSLKLWNVAKILVLKSLFGPSLKITVFLTQLNKCFDGS